MSTGKYLFMSHSPRVSNPVDTSAGKYLFMSHSPRVSNTVDMSDGKYLFIDINKYLPADVSTGLLTRGE
jgi:hypothetical protein